MSDFALAKLERCCGRSNCSGAETDVCQERKRKGKTERDRCVWERMGLLEIRGGTE